MEIFERIFKSKIIGNEDIEELKVLNLVFNDYKFNHQGYNVFGYNIKKTITTASLIESYQKSKKFFNGIDYFDWYIQLYNYKIKLFEINFEVDFMIIYLEYLKSVLEKIYSQFNPGYFNDFDTEETNENELYDINPEYVKFTDHFNYVGHIDTANAKLNLKLRKEFFINAISRAKMFYIQMSLVNQDEIDYQTFVQKCIEAIKVIEFEMIANDNPIEETIKYLEMNNTTLNQKIEDEIISYQENDSENINNPIKLKLTPTIFETENTNTSNSDIKITKTFPEFLLHTENEKLAEGLKKQFSTGKGKKIRIMLEALKQTSPKIFTLSIGDNLTFYTALTEYFNRNIGSYTAIFQCDFDFNKDKPSIDDAIAKINHVISTL